MARKLSEEDIDLLLKRVQDGESYSRVAKDLGVTKACISYHVRRRTGISRDPRKLSDSQIDEIVERWKQGERFSSLAAEFEVGTTTVRGHVRRRLGMVDGRHRRVLAVSVPKDPTKLAYLAALIDCEGCLTRHGRKPSRNWALTITNTSPELRRWLEPLRGRFYKPAPVRSTSRSGGWRRDVYVWKISAAIDVLTVLQAVQPFLIIKRERAAEAVCDIVGKLEGVGMQLSRSEM